MNDCVFCKIVAGEIPCHKLYEDDHLLAFLDVGPLGDGHSLIIPKQHIVRLDEADESNAAMLAAIGGVAAKLGKAVSSAVGCEGWNLLQNNGEIAGQVVMHVHFHVIPRRDGDGLGYRWNPGELDGEKAKALREKIAAGMG